MDKLKSWFGWLVAGLVAVVGVLAYILKLKQDQVDGLQADKTLQDTTKKSDALDTQINQDKQVVANNDMQIAKDTMQLEQLKQQEQNIQPKVDPTSRCQYWNNQK